MTNHTHHSLASILAVLAALVFVASGDAAPTIHSIVRSTHSSNTHIIYDDNQILVVDTGMEEEDAAATIAWLDKMTQDGQRHINAFFITHGHPDHCMNLWKMQEAFPGVPAYVATVDIKNELVNLMTIFGQYLNQSSPGNPVAKNVSSHYDYTANIHTVLAPGESADPATYIPQIWNGTEIELLAGFTTTAETNHYSFLYLPTISSFLTGDFLDVRSHMFMGYDVSLMSQCDWLAHLRALHAALPPNTLLYPGHGTVGLPPGANTTQQVLEENMQYLAFARSVFVNTCNPQLATKQLLRRYPSYAGQFVLTAFTVPSRVPADASALGCGCAQDPVDVCNIQAPPCAFAPSLAQEAQRKKKRGVQMGKSYR